MDCPLAMPAKTSSSRVESPACKGFFEEDVWQSGKSAPSVRKSFLIPIPTAWICGYQTGDMIVFAPSRAVLPPDLRPDYVNAETDVSYLVGAEHDRVSGIRLRGELSEGITINLQSRAQVRSGAGNRRSSGYQQIRADSAGNCAGLKLDVPFRQHDVEQFGIFGAEFSAGEEVVVTEKIHGSQMNALFRADGSIHVTSKGLASKGLEIGEDKSASALFISF